MSNRLLTSTALWKAMSKSLGLEGQRVRSMTIYMELDELVIVEIEMFVLESALNELEPITKKYHLAEIPEEDS